MAATDIRTYGTNPARTALDALAHPLDWPAARRRRPRRLRRLLAARDGTAPTHMLRFITAVTVAACLSASAAAQVQRTFPQNALRGAIVVGVAPEIAAERRSRRGSRPARASATGNNMLVMPGALTGGRLLVHYTRRHLGPGQGRLDPAPGRGRGAAVADDAGSRPQAWLFDPVGQAWIKP